LRPLSLHRLTEAAGFRHGIVPPWEEVAPAAADLPGFHNVCVVGDTDSTRDSTSGALARTRDAAIGAALGEALERYAAGIARFPLRTLAALDGRPHIPPEQWALFSPEQQRAPGFAWPAVAPAAVHYAPVFALADNSETWVPEALVGLGSHAQPACLPSTSTGLAAHPDRLCALLRAVEELLERDAFAAAWLCGLRGREVALPARYTQPVAARGGDVRCFDVTQIWNPHPVMVVCGQLPLAGVRRFSLGAACRGDHAGAVEKAFLEWVQGTIFAGYYLNRHPGLRFASPADVRDFHQHGVYYTLHPQHWPALPLLAGDGPARPLPAPAEFVPPAAALVRLQAALASAGVRLYYRDLTTPDVRALGMTAVRALSPELTLLHGDEQAPFLGGRARDVAWRWPGGRTAGAFPNPQPHPLG
jgi:ribosomal protein S12 methylthiotransferase accessory factor